MDALVSANLGRGMVECEGARSPEATSNPTRKPRSVVAGGSRMYNITAYDVAWARSALDRASPPLSEEQARYVTAPVAPVTMIAAAGSGKTRCLQEKLDREILARGENAVLPLSTGSSPTR